MAGSDSQATKWKIALDPEGKEYAFDEQTNETRWLWARLIDPISNKPYEHNFITNETRWVDAPQVAMTDSTSAGNVTSPTKGASSQSSKPELLGMPTNANSNTVISSKVPTTMNADQSAAVGSALSSQTVAKSTTATKKATKESSVSKSVPISPDEVMYVTSEGKHYAFNNATKASRWLTADQQQAFINRQRSCDTVTRTFRTFKAKQIVGRMKSLATKYRSVLSEIHSLCGWKEEHLLSPNDDVARVLGSPTGERSPDFGDHPIYSVFVRHQVAREQGAKSPQWSNGAGGSYTYEEVHIELASLYKKLLLASELITQNTIKLDQVETEGMQVVRHHRKQAVKQMVVLGDRVDHLKAETNVLIKESSAALDEANSS